MKHTLDPSEDSSSETNPKCPKHDIPDTSKDSSMAESSENNPEPPKQSPRTSEDSSMAEVAEDQSMADPSEDVPETSEQKPPRTSEDIPETSEQKPPHTSEDIPETSEQKPPRSFSSSLLFYPPNELNNAIDALSHANPEGMGIMEVVANGVRILCQMPFHSGFFYLDLNPGGNLMDLIFMNHFKKRVPLKEIFNILDGSDDKIVEIEYADGSEELTFTFGIPHNDDVLQEEGEKSVTVHVVDDGSEVVPNITPIIEAVSISVQDLMKIIQQVEDDESIPVVFEMLNGTASIKVEQEELTSFKYEENDANKGITHAQFQFVQCECLKKALGIAEDVLLCLGTDPRVLTLQFNLGELGDIVYIISESTDPSVQMPETSIMGHQASASGADQ